MAPRRKHAFVLYLWVEGEPDRDQGEPAWRGSIEHLPTKRRLYFSVLTDLMRFLSRHIDETSARATSDDA